MVKQYMAELIGEQNAAPSILQPESFRSPPTALQRRFFSVRRTDHTGDLNDLDTGFRYRIPLDATNSIGLQIVRALRRIIRRTAEHSRQLGRESGLTVPQLLCLRAIRDLQPSGEVTGRSVAEFVQLSEATVSRILDRLEQAGMVIRQRASDDRRRVYHSLSESGEQQLLSMPTPLHEQLLKRLDSLNLEERLELLTAVERIVDFIDAREIDAAPLLTPEIEMTSGQDSV